MKSKLIAQFAFGVIFAVVFLVVIAGQTAPATAALCSTCRDLMFTDSTGKCSDCGAQTSSAALKLCPKCSARRHQCEHCLAGLSAKDEASDNSPVAPSPQTISQPQLSPPSSPPSSSSSESVELHPAAPEAPAFSSPDLPPPTASANQPTLPGPASATPREPASQVKLKPINPAKEGTSTAGKWRFQLQIHGTGRSEGRWGWLTYDGHKLPRGNVNDYYITPWGPMYWVDVPSTAWGLHGFMPAPTPQVARQGRTLALPAAYATASPAQPTATADAPSPALPSTQPKVQTLEINRSHNGQLARLHLGNVLIIRLPGNPASGYEWQVGTANSKALKLTVRPQFSPASSTSSGAAAGTYTFVYQAAQVGSGSLRLYCVRPADPSHPRETFAIGVNVTPATSATTGTNRSAGRSSARDLR